MIDLNELAKQSLETSRKRQSNGANLDADKVLKHCSTELIEAQEARDIWKLNKDSSLKDKLFRLYSEELADLIICVLVESANNNVDIEKALLDKMKLNELRANKLGDKL